MTLPTEQFDGENGCISPQLYPTVQQRLFRKLLQLPDMFLIRFAAVI